MPFPVFKDFQKSASDLFTEDFDTKYSLKVKSPGPLGLVLTTNTQYDVSKENKLVTKISAKYPHSSGFTVEKFEIASNGAATTETSLVTTLPGLKLEFKGNDSDKGDLGLIYTHPLFTFTSELDALNLAKASASISSGQEPISFGASADINLAKSGLGPVSTNVAYKISNFELYLKTNKTFSEYSALARYFVNKDITLAGQAIYGKAWNFIFAGVYKCNPDTIMKLKASNSAGVALSIKQSLDKKFSITGVADVPITLDSAKFGVTASLG